MELFDKHMGKEKKESLELAEASRQKEWMLPSYVFRLFQGAPEWGLIHPFPEQSKEDKEEGDKFLKILEEFLKANLNPDDVDVTREIPEGVVKGLVEMGAFAIKVPKEYDGLGLSQVNYNRAVHLLGSYCGSTAALISAHQSIGVPQPLILFGTEEQKKKYLPRFRQGAISGFALTETAAGSDPRMIKTTATPIEDGKYYLINGEKLWCTNGNIADILVVMAVTQPKIVGGKEKKQITAFIVETDTPGFEVAYRCKFMGLNAIQNGLIRFNNVKVPKENIILGEGEGLKLAFLTLNTGRLTLPAAVTGMSKWCLWVARQWASQRKQWGSAIGEHEAIASKLSSIAGTVFAMDAVTWLVSHMADNKRYDIRLEAAMAKLFCTEESWKIVDKTVQIRGGRGYETKPSLKGRGETDYPVERAMRDSRVNTILEGSSEIMHLFIAREALDFHLNKIKNFLDPKIPITKKAVLALSVSIGYLFWYLKLMIPSFGSKVKLPRPLCGHAKYVNATAKRLARSLFHKMIFYQQKLVQRQNLLNRFVDIGTDLFAISSVCSYADSLAKKGGAKETMELADYFCCQAKARIERRFDEVSRNDDRLSDRVAKKILGGNYEWLEDDIIK
ncbi:MAG: acyl-CoA dehydrogenase family protein [Candidatus Omnitrophica bacterium]|nr:acyl-CoA dehydrogenase family protein [Candidatus Omnitrophota bacterium]